MVYFEEYERIDEAFYREKQVQGWNREKKEALINGKPELLPELAKAYRDLDVLKNKNGLREPQPSDTQLSEALEDEASASNNKINHHSHLDDLLSASRCHQPWPFRLRQHE